MTEQERERQATAYHEAGHAAMGLLLGRLPLSATIERVGGMAGHAEFEKDIPAAWRYFDQSDAKQQYLETRIMITVAGSLAHDRLEPGRARDQGDQMDFDHAREMLDESWPVSDDERRDYLARLCDQARERLGTQWRLVEQIAAALMERSTLSRDDLVAIFRDS